MYKWNWKGSVWANERQLRSSDAIRQASMGLCAICKRVITELISGQLGGQSDLWAWTTERERLNRLMTRSLFTIEEDCDRPQTAHLAFTTKQAWGQISLKPESQGKADRRERKGQCFGKWEGLEERTGNSREHSCCLKPLHTIQTHKSPYTVENGTLSTLTWMIQHSFTQTIQQPHPHYQSLH